MNRKSIEKTVFVRKTAIGSIAATLTKDGALLRLDLCSEGTAETPGLLPCSAAEVFRQLEEYFSGKRKVFELDLAPEGTPFQQSVWAELQKIPYGQTATYGELAKRLGRPKASRAVGGANHCNPIPVIIPCHRVIGANSKLTGYALGLALKEKLLALEQR